MAVCAGIAEQIRGFAPAGSTLPVARAATPPALDGSLDGWTHSTPAKFAIDGLNVDQPAQIEARLLYDAEHLYPFHTTDPEHSSILLLESCTVAFPDQRQPLTGAGTFIL